MNFDILSFIFGKLNCGSDFNDVVSYLLGKAISAVWTTIRNVAIASFTAVVSPLKEFIVDITPMQAGSGDPSPTNVRPISGWTGANVTRTGKNLLGGIIVANRIADGASSATIDESAKTITFDTVGNDGTLLLINDSTQGTKFYPFKLTTAYTIIGKLSRTGSGTSFGLGVIYTDGTSYRVQTSDIDSDGYLVFTTNASKTVRGIFAGYQQVNGQLLYYDTFGVYEGAVAKTDSARYTGTTYTVTFPTPPGTVYGGTLNDNGDGTWTLTVRWVGVDLAALTWTPDAEHGTFSSSNLRTGSTYKYIQQINTSMSASVVARVEKYNPISLNEMTASYPDNSFAITTTGNIVVKADVSPSGFLAYQIKNGQTLPEYTLTAESVKTLLGSNNIFADCGNINTITYRER